MNKLLLASLLAAVALAACQASARFGEPCRADGDCVAGATCGATTGTCERTPERVQQEREAQALAATEADETVRVMTEYAERICASEDAVLADAQWIELHHELGLMRDRLLRGPMEQDLLAQPTVAAFHEAYPPKPEALAAAERVKACLHRIRAL